MSELNHSGIVQFQQGYQTLEINQKEPLSLRFESNGKSEVFLKVNQASTIQIDTLVHPGDDVTLLIWNEAKSEVQFEETYQVLQNAHLKLAYGEMEVGISNHKVQVDLKEEGANAQVSSGTLANTKKAFVMNVASLAPHTFGTMNHYSVVLKEGHFSMEATGQITKGSYQSESHQTSRALCFDEEMNAKIVPILLIDENDVKASHATSLGRMDEEQLYYMQTRGLTMSQCTALISTGYLLPVADTIEDETLKSTLKEEIERKIATLCLM